MQITIKINTTPKTLTREQAALMCNRDVDTIDLAMDSEKIDWGYPEIDGKRWNKKTVLVIDNRKFQSYVLWCAERDKKTEKIKP